MRPDTYPKAWRSRGEQAEAPAKVSPEVDLARLESESEF
jgi:hypothetical protein